MTNLGQRMDILALLRFDHVGLKAIGVLLASAGFAAAAAQPTPGKEWFERRLRGEGMKYPDSRKLRAKEVAGKQAALWAEYKEAAMALGWDKELAEAVACPAMPPREALQAMPESERPKLPEFEASVMPCGEENMPYLLLTRGPRPTNGYPLFFQTHGGGSTNKKLSGPHGWEVNSIDWKSQVRVCLTHLPEGMYFIPRMANDNKGRWWMKHNHIAFDKIIRRTVLFRNVDPDRIYMMGISEGAYGTEAMTPFWADRFAGGCAMAGGAGGGERFYNLRNTAFRNDTGENDTMFGRIKLARQAHEYLDNLQKTDPEGYDHLLAVQAGRGHSIDYKPGPAWIATKLRNTRPTKICWFNFVLDGQRRSDFSWLSLSHAPARDTLIVAEADRRANSVTVSARINPPDVPDSSAVYNTFTAAPVTNRVPYTGNTITLHLDDRLLDLNRRVTVVLNGRKVFSGKVDRLAANMADDIARYGDPGRIYPARVLIKL